MTSISQRIAALSPEKRELLLQRLKSIASQEQDVSLPENGQGRGQVPPLRAYARTTSTHFPLSFVQQRLWFLDQLEPGSAAYLLPSVYQLRGLLNIQCLEKSLEALIQRHESLRTTFVVETVLGADPQPVQIIHPMDRKGQGLLLPVIDLQGLRQEERVAQQRRLATQEAQHPCDLEEGPLLRLHLLRFSIEEHILLLTLHHIVFDGWSLEILLRELSEVYSIFIQGRPSPLSALPIQYADYALWQRQWLEGEILQKQLDYWKQQLAGSPPMLNLPTDRPRPPMQTSNGAQQSLLLSSELLQQLKTLGQQENITLFMIGLAAFQVLLMRYSGQQDIVVGIPTVNRGQEELERLIGFFVNTLALRTDLSGNPSFQDLLVRVREIIFEADAHQELPFEKLVEELQLERDLSRQPLFQVFFTLQNTSFPSLELPGISCAPMEPPYHAARFDLSLMLVEMENGLLTVAEYNTDLFNSATITRLLNHWQVLLEAIVRDPAQSIETLPLLTEPEMHQLLVAWNNTARNISHDLCLHHLIEQQVEQTPDAIAVISEQAGTNHTHHLLTYEELNTRANQLAHRLRAIGIGPEKLVAVYMQRSLELVVALLAILKAGGAYLPLDPDYPQTRLASILADAQPTVLLTRRDRGFLTKNGLAANEKPLSVAATHRRKDGASWYDTICLDREWEALAAESQSNLVNTTQPEQTAYVIYTSGSTGMPKGVMVSHRNVVNFFRGMDEHIGEPTPSIWLAVTSISFDISVLELFWTLTQGFQVVLHTPLNTVPLVQAQPHVEKELAFSLFYFASDAAEQTTERYRLLLEGAKFADEHGFQALWTPERHFHAFGGLYPNPSITSAAIAAVTQHIQIRAGSVVLPLHHPIRVAEDWAVIDNLSHGRVGIAFASGWHANDFVFAPDKYAQRRELLLQDIETVRKLWRGESIMVQGGTGQHIEVKTLPRPVQAELPVWITSAGSPETFRLAGEAGANVLTHLLGQDLDQLAAKIAIYRKAWHGHDTQGKTGHVTLMVHTFIGTDLPTVRETVRQPFRAYLRSSIDLLQGFAQSQGLDINAESFHEDDLEALLDHAFERYFESSGLMGTIDSCLPMIENLQAIGVDELACLIDFGVAVDDVLASLQHLQELKERVGVGGGVGPGGGLGRPPSPITNHPIAPDLGRPLLEYGVSHLQCTPSLMHMLLMDSLAPTALQGLSQLLLGGEELPLALLKQLQTLTTAKLHNMYGPTETTIWSTTSVVEPDIQEISLGSPIANTQVYLLDAHLQPVPIGVTGEIYIGGEGVARGYLNQPELTAERFLPDPWDMGGGGRLYQTGDMARYHENGQLEYLGRRDQQVKLRGHRIELGEIEASLRAHPAIQEAVVVLREEHRIGKHLVAYVGVGGAADVGWGSLTDPGTTEEAEWEPRVDPVPTDTPTRDDLYAYLRRHLPQYMVPANIVFQERLPLTPNGKIDRKTLADLEGNIGDVGMALDAEMTPLQTPLQVQLAMIWTELLHQPQVSIRSNFFALGGHSLLAAQLMLCIQTAFEVKVPLRSLFEAPTIAEMAEIIERLQNEIGAQEKCSQTTIVPRKLDTTAAIPLSFAQERLWFLDQLAPNSTSYVVSQPFHLSGSLQIKALERSLTAVVQRHEILRTTFSSQEGRPVQVIVPHLVLQVPVIDLSGLPTAAVCYQQTKRLVQQDAHHPFDLAHGPLLRLHMLRLTPQEQVILFTLHHIISDGKWSMSILVRELSALYQAELEGKPAPLPALPIQYADYAIWQRQWLQGEVLEGQLAYWQRQLSGMPARSIKLPTDRPRPAVQTNAGSLQSLLLSPSLLQELMRLSLEAGVTLFMTLLAAFQVLLMRYSGQQDIAVGTPIAGRGQAGLENLIGFFVNTLVLRSDLSGNPSFRQLLTRVREVALQAYAHQDLPFEKLVDSLQVERSLSHSPLFQVFFVLQNAPNPDITLTDITFRQLAAERFTSLFDLSLELIEGERGLLTQVEYSTDLFDVATIERLLGHWSVLLEAIICNPEQQIEMLPLLTETESHRLLVEWNNTTKNIPLDLCLHQLFEQQVEQTPEAIAIVFEEQQITYQELNDQANQLAHRLHREGVGPDVLVGVCMERSLELVVALLAVLKAGGAYVPLDPNYPQERLTFLLADAQVPVVLTQAHLREPMGQAHRFLPNIEIIYVESDPSTSELESRGNPKSGVLLENLAYIIYTSGSTGKPKGVMVTHANVTRLFTMTNDWFHFQTLDTWTFFHSSSFDFSVWEVWGSLLHGSRLVVVPYWLSRSLDEFHHLLVAEQVTVLNQTPSAFAQLMQADLASAEHMDLALRLVIFGGEALDFRRLRPWFAHHGDQHPRLVNMYGITETTVHVTYYPLAQTDVQVHQGSVIGGPLPDVQCYVLDAHYQLVPPGIAGELYIGGMGLARGYWQNAPATAERFVPHPFVGIGKGLVPSPWACPQPGARLYRTGDLARYLADGRIEYLGRIDSQVKLRGFRIELGEIEATLQAHPAVKEAVVVLREEDELRKYLVAYVTTRADVGEKGGTGGDPGEASSSLRYGVSTGTEPPTLTASALQEHLREQLPDYMIPARVVFLDAIPLTPNSKVDRKALPIPDWSQLPEGREMVEPQTPLQEQLAIIWTKLLHLPQVGIHHNFFELGGHSLLATQLMARIRTIFQIEVPLRRLFESPTIEGLALAIEQIQTEQIEQEESEMVAQMFSELGGLSEDEMQEVFTDEKE